MAARPRPTCPTAAADVRQPAPNTKRTLASRKHLWICLLGKELLSQPRDLTVWHKSALQLTLAAIFSLFVCFPVCVKY